MHVYRNNYSTVREARCRYALSRAEFTFNFTITYRSSMLNGGRYSGYLLSLNQTIRDYRKEGVTFDAIADKLNDEGILSPRGRRFTGAHVHSIFKRRLAKREWLERECPPVWSDVRMEVVDKTILMSEIGFTHRMK